MKKLGVIFAFLGLVASNNLWAGSCVLSVTYNSGTQTYTVVVLECPPWAAEVQQSEDEPVSVTRTKHVVYSCNTSTPPIPDPGCSCPWEGDFDPNEFGCDPL